MTCTPANTAKRGRLRAEIGPGDLRGALPPVKGRHFAAVTEPDQIAAVLRAIDGYEGTLPVRCALRLAPLVFVRPGELRKAEWADIDLDAAEWRYTVTQDQHSAYRAAVARRKMMRAWADYLDKLKA